MPEKWTQELRRIAFARFAMEFGRNHGVPHGDELPLPPRMTEDEVLTQIAHYFTWLTGEKFEATEVKAQLAWATSRQATVPRDRTKQFILCKAAAHEVGLIPNQPARRTTLGA